MVIIRAKILKVGQGDQKDQDIIVEKMGKSRSKTLLAFWWDCRKYANKDHKVLKIETSDPTIITELQGNQATKDIPMDLIDDPISEKEV